MVYDLTTAGVGPVAPVALAPVTPAAPKLIAEDADQERGARRAMALHQVIRPEARDRWTGLVVRGMTPRRVQQILESAFAGSLVGQFALFDLMEDTWHRLKKNLNEVKRSVERADWHVNAFALPGKEPTASAQQRADLLAQSIKTFRPRPESEENGFGAMVYDLCDAVGKGLSVQEILWDLREDYQGQGPAIVPQAASWVPARYYGYYGLEADLQLSPTGYGSDWGPFPPDKFVIARFKTKTGHTLTGALLRSLATFWIGSNFCYDWALNLAQLFGLPFRWVEYDPKTQKGLLDDICAMLESMGSAGWGAFPTGTKLQLHEAVKNASETPQAYLMKLADTACDVLILGQTLTSSEGKSGSRALGEVHSDVRTDVLEYIAAWAADRLNESYTPALMRLNFGDEDEPPTLVCEVPRAKDQKLFIERDQIFLSCGGEIPEDFFYDRHDVPKPKPGEKTIKMAAPAPPAKPGDPTADDGEEDVNAVAAKDATDKLVDGLLENLTGVEAKWLGNVRPFFAGLVGMAESGQVTDVEFLNTVELAAKVMPELFDKLNGQALETALNDAMAAGLVNGVSQGVMQRRVKA